MSTTLINMLVLAVLIGTVALFFFTYFSNKKRRAQSQSGERFFHNHLAQQQFAPDRLSSFAGTGLALKAGDHRVALLNRGKVVLYPLADILGVDTFESTATARPLGAAPGVVEVREFKVFNLALRIRNLDDPVIVRFENEEEMRQWEVQIKQLAAI